MKYQSLLLEKCAKVLDKNTNNVKIAFLTSSNLIKTILKKMNFIKRSHIYNCDPSSVHQRKFS